jgi:hypothetical protein
MELSPVLIKIFRSMPQSQGLYENTASMVEKWNDEIKQEKAKQRKANLRRLKRK